MAESKEQSDMIEISKEEYYRLKCDELKLEMLYAGGVDNWDWYEDSLNPDGERSCQDWCDIIRSQIFT